MVEIQESYLLAFLTVVFVPVFVFCIKMVMEVGTIKANLDGFRNEMNVRFKEISKDVERTQKDIENLFNKLDNYKRRERGNNI